MARTNLGKIVMIPKGTYSTTVTYSKLDVVTSNGSGYISKSDNNLNKPLTNETYWMKLVEKGDKGDKGDSYIITEADIQEIEDYVVTKTSGQIVSTRNELERVKNDVLETGTDTDTFIHVEDSAMAELQELSIDGVCEQNTTTGKNKLPNNAVSNTLNGVTFKKNSDGSIIANGIANISTTFIINNDIVPKNISNLILNGCPNNGSNATYDLKIELYQNNVWKNELYDFGNGLDTGDLSEYTSCRISITIRKNYNANNLIFKPMISSDGGEYEPYTGGQPSPSPDYPQEIKTITNSLKVTSCGRNLLKNIATSATVNGVSFTVNDDGSVLANGTATADAAFKILPIATKFSQNLILSPNKTYTLSDSVGNYTDYFTQIVIQDANGNKKWYNTAGDIDISTNVIANIYTAQIYVRNGRILDNILFKPQFVVKDSTNLFEQHIETQITAKLPEGEFIGKLDDTYKDTLRAKWSPEEGQYHLILDKKVGKYTFTGNETWSMNYGTAMFYSSNNFRTASELTRFGKCTHYIYNSTNSDMFNSLSNNQFAIQYYDGNTNIFIKDLRYSSIDDFKNMLKTNNIEIYYILKTPYTLDLGVIDMPMSYKDITNIFTDSDLLPQINAKYYRNFITTVQNLQVNEKALKQELVDINARLSALESANASVTTESEVTE